MTIAQVFAAIEEPRKKGGTIPVGEGLARRSNYLARKARWTEATFGNS